MTAGSIVVYLADPLMYGRMIVVEITANGRVLCECIHKDGADTYPRELFDAHELELADKWAEVAS
jgi:hypothetical protein